LQTLLEIRYVEMQFGYEMLQVNNITKMPVHVVATFIMEL